MANYYDVDQQTTDYRGLFGWNTFTQPFGTTSRPAMEIELFIKEHSIPIRKKKMTEITGVQQIEPRSERETGTVAVFEGAPDMLTLTLSGWTRTPITSGAYAPTDKNGTTVAAFAGLSYTEIISAYLDGRMNQSIGEAYQRLDPDYFISPYGHKYNNPVISVWEPAGIAGYGKKHNFSCTLLLEK